MPGSTPPRCANGCAPGKVKDCQVTLEPRVRGHFRIVMTAPGGPIVNSGEFRLLDRPAKLQFAWVSSRWANQETLVTVELFRREARCKLVLTHERFPLGHSAEQLGKGGRRFWKNSPAIAESSAGAVPPEEPDIASPAFFALLPFACRNRIALSP